MKSQSLSTFGLAIPVACALACACLLFGCTRSGPVGNDIVAVHGTAISGDRAGGARMPVVEGAPGNAPPADLASVTFGRHALSLWPYTGNAFDGTPSDPVNLVFVGQADPVAIRDALLALDTDRTAAGFPPVYPFNARWTDATGDVQTNWAQGDGWVGSVVQLQLGVYDPMRVHLRLFRTGSPYGDGGTWTVGAAHFEVLIPGTADHQVLSWELAEQVVVADLVRSGLLDTTTPLAPSGVINATPTFRGIPDYIYNALPPELIALTGGPAQPIEGEAPIASDGRATILDLAGRAPAAGGNDQTFTLTYDQVVPRPLCASGPTDWIYVQGPVTFHKTAAADGAGGYVFDASFAGHLTATPVDITHNPPVPVGEPFAAIVGETQHGELDLASSSASSFSRRLIPGHGGSEFVNVRLKVATHGRNQYDVDTRCR